MKSDLSLEEKVGQVLMLGFAGKDPEGAREAVCDLKVGGIIYFARNTGSVAETASLSAALQDMAASASNLPLLISIDQEGGLVARLTEGLPLMPGPMSLGAAGDENLAFEVSRAIGEQIRAAGANINLAPDLDVNDNPLNPVIGVRSFGSDPALVERLGTAAVRGFMAAGVAPVGKHFPGHGNTSVDSHLDLPVLPHPMERLNQVELRPFRAAIAAGIPAIMTAHIVFEAIDPERPATLSAPVLQGLLRKELGFQGVIMTDCMEMNAISKNPGTARGAVLALKAGADMVLISHTPELQREAYRLIIDAVKSGEIPVDRLDDAVERVLALKKALKIPNPLPVESADSDEFRQLSGESHLRSITIVKSKGLPVLPGSPSAPEKPSCPSRVAVLSPFPAGDLVAELAALSGAEVKEITTHREGDLLPDIQGAVMASIRGVDRVIMLTRNAWKDAAQAQLAKAVLEARPDAVVVATRDPYDIRVLRKAETYLCTYSHRPEALRALAAVLAGEAPAGGKLPVTLG